MKRLKRLISIPFTVLIISSMIGCTHRLTVNGVDKSNSIKVTKVEFVNGFEDDPTNEVATTSYKSTDGLYCRAYFDNVPSGSTKVKISWKRNGELLTNSTTATLSEDELHEPVPVFLNQKDNSIVPDGDYTLDIYQADTNTLLNESTIAVKK